MSERALAVAAAVALTVCMNGCGGGSQTTTRKHERPETVQKLPKLAEGWRARRDRTIGYGMGIPPGWEVGDRRDGALIRSPDHLVAVTLTADRGSRAFAVPVKRFAAKALGALPGFKVPLHAGRPKPFHGTPLDAAVTTASGEQASGLKERATLIVLRRDRLVNYTVAVLENAERSGSALDRAVALRVVRTLRDVPPKSSGPNGDGGG
jgi:hypothetical protein